MLALQMLDNKLHQAEEVVHQGELLLGESSQEQPVDSQSHSLKVPGRFVQTPGAAAAQAEDRTEQEQGNQGK